MHSLTRIRVLVSRRYSCILTSYFLVRSAVPLLLAYRRIDKQIRATEKYNELCATRLQSDDASEERTITVDSAGNLFNVGYKTRRRFATREPLARSLKLLLRPGTTVRSPFIGEETEQTRRHKPPAGGGGGELKI